MRIYDFNCIQKTPLSLLKKYKLCKIPVDIVKFAKALNINISKQEYYKSKEFIEMDQAEKMRGFMVVDKRNNIREISIDCCQSFEYKRFVTAYLVCGYLMNKMESVDENKSYMWYIDGKLDDEILFEAKNLTVPDKLLKQEMSKMKEFNYESLEEKFNVPDTILREKILEYRK